MPLCPTDSPLACLATAFAALFALLSFCIPASAAPPTVSELPVIKELPDPFRMPDGKRVATRHDWEKQRGHLRDLILTYEYGHLPPAPNNLRAEMLSTADALDGQATDRRFLLSGGADHAVKFHLNLLTPKTGGKHPVILTGDLCWGPAPLREEMIRRGYALAEFDRTEVAPDKPDRTVGIYSVYPESDGGALVAWAWAYMRAIDFLSKQNGVDARKIAVSGHSRGGKAALLAGALDNRIALVNPNGSGCGGTGPYRMTAPGSEQLKDILEHFPYWFSRNLPPFIGHEDQLPFDQHTLMALVAPRPMLVTSAFGDAWADPSGTQLTFLATREVYGAFGAADRLASHYREGAHAHNTEDWSALLDFADHLFAAKPLPAGFEGHTFSNPPTAFSWTAPRF